MGLTKLLESWPLVRQVREGDALGRGRAVQSPRSRALKPRIDEADHVSKSICPYCAVGCALLRVFKVTSPMSVGSWTLAVSSGASNTAAALELLGVLQPVKALAETVSFLAGPPLATYTGTLLADTAIPVWHEARRELPCLFGASASASAVRRRRSSCLRRRRGRRGGSRSPAPSPSSG